MGFLAADIDPVKSDPPLFWGNNPHNAPEGRRLACSVSSEQGDQFPLLDFRRDPFEDMAFAIIGVDVLKKKHLHASQISLLDFLIVRDLRSRPFCQDPPLVQYRNDV